jgi:hypothetical protein
MKTTILILATSFVVSSLSAEMILHEPFDVKLDPDATYKILGNHNGWQMGYEQPEESQTMVRDANLHSVSPFPTVGLAAQPTSTKTSAYKKLPEELNGKTVYFSLLMKTFPPAADEPLRGISGLRFRSDLGTVLFAGQVNVMRGLQISNDMETWGEYDGKTNYLMIGKIEITKDGQKIEMSCSFIENRKDLPSTEPEKWEKTSKTTLGRDMVWNAVECYVASSNTAMDDLRISTDWSDISGK